MADLQFSLDFLLKGGGLIDGKRLLSEFSAELRTAQAEHAKLDAAGVRFDGSADRWRDASGRFVKAAEGSNVALSALTTGVGLFAAAMAAGIKVLDDFGDKAIKSFGERGSAIRAYTTLLGDAQQAEIEFNKGQALAAQTDLTAAETQKAQQTLLVAGFRGEQKDALLLGGLDLASIATGDKNQALASFARSVSQINQKGKLQQEELLQLAEGASLSTKLVKEELAKILGVKDMAAVDKAQSAGKVTADQGLLAIQRAILAQLGTEQLGQFATGSAGAIGSLLSNRDEAMENLLKSFDSEAVPAVTRYKEALTDQNEALSVSSDTGSKLAIVLQDFANTSLSLKATWTDFVTGFLEVFAKSYEEAMSYFGVGQEALDGMGAKALDFGRTLGNVGYLAATAVRAVEWLGSAFITVSDVLDDFGRMLVGLADVFDDLASGNFAKAREDFQKTFASKDENVETITPDKDYGEAGATYGGGETFKVSAAKKKSGGAGGGGGKGGGGAAISFDYAAAPADLAAYPEALAASLAPASAPAAPAAPEAPAAAARETPQQVVIHVHPSAGMDERRLAEEVAKVLRRATRTPAPGRS